MVVKNCLMSERHSDIEYHQASVEARQLYQFGVFQ